MTIRTEQGALLDAIKNNTGSAIRPNTVILIDDTEEHTGPFFCITALADSVIDHSACTTNIIDGADFTLPKGVTIFGEFSSIALTAGGSVIGYTL